MDDLDAHADDNEKDEKELILQKHRKEKKEFIAKTQKLKRGIAKGDKKGWKQLQEQIAEQQKELEDRHEAELKKIDETILSSVDAVSDDVTNLSIGEDAAAAEGSEGIQFVPKKRSRAQKRRELLKEKKAAAEREREERIREQEIQNLTGPRHLEQLKVESMLKDRGLSVYEIPSDGNCLYAAIVHQLKSEQVSVDSLRQLCAQHMRENADDFLPFLCKAESGDSYTEEEYEAYCQELELTAAWGGQLEIKALSSVLRKPLEVIQADGPSVTTGEEYSSEPLVLPYYRHAFGLGEHYNSVQPLTFEDQAA